jgi:hypothetical protein
LNSPIFELFLSLSTDKDWQNAVKVNSSKDPFLDGIKTGKN